MRNLTIPTLILTLAACSSQDDRDATELARKAFDAGDYATAEAHYAEALAEVPAEDEDYLDLKIEHLQALCYVNGDEVLEEATALEGRLDAAHYRKLASELFSADAHEQAGKVMHAGNTAYPDDPVMKTFSDSLVKKIQDGGDDAANDFIRGSGYGGG